MRKTFLVSLVLASLLPCYAFSACEDPAAVMAQVKKIEQPAEKAAFLGKIPAACRDFSIANALGESSALAGNMGSAKSAFMESLDSATSKEQQAEAFYNLGVVAQQEGKKEEAIRNFRASIKRKHSPELENHLLELEKNAGKSLVSAATIVADLSPTTVTGSTKNFKLPKAFKVCPSIDITVEFDFAAYRLTTEGRRQADEIAKSMSNEGFDDLVFRIVGHTDLKGSDQANDKLSLKRAESLKEYLVKSGGVDTKRLSVQGKGKREPLYRSPKEQDRNRRVEIVLLSATGGEECK